MCLKMARPEQQCHRQRLSFPLYAKTEIRKTKTVTNQSQISYNYKMTNFEKKNNFNVLHLRHLSVYRRQNMRLKRHFKNNKLKNVT